MIVSKAPMRVSLFGGGSDYPAFFNRHGGSVLGFAADKYTRIYIRPLLPFSSFKHRLVYSTVEDVNLVSEIKHPAIRAVLQEHWGDDRPGLEITHMGDLPAMSGMGTSSSFVVALIRGIERFKGLNPMAATELAQEAIRIEQVVIAEAVGCQDQVWAALGGYNRVDFTKDGFTARALPVKDFRADILDYLMLGFTGATRHAHKIAQEVINQMGQNTDAVKRMVGYVDEAERILLNQEDIRGIGELLHDTWMLKRGLTGSITNPEIDEMYGRARIAGAIGGKLLGAGAGGFLLHFVDHEKQGAVRAALPDRIWVPIGMDFSGATAHEEP